MSDSKCLFHQSIARSLQDHGVDTVFGLIGDANLFIVDHYVKACSGKFISVSYEGSAVLMAMAYAYLSGKTAVATVTHGPALTNCVTALTEAARNGCPMVVLAGDTPVSALDHLQSTDQRELVAVTGAGFEQMRSPQTAAEDVSRAFYRARTEKRPIVLNMPADFMWQDTEHQQCVRPVFEAPAKVESGADHEAAVGMLASARRPLILAGRGALNAKTQIINLAERLDAPVATTLKAKGLFDDHSHNIGIFGTLSTPAAYDVMGTCDVIVAFGASLHQFTTDQGKLMRSKRVIQVNDNARDIGRYFAADAGIVADAGLTAENFTFWMDEAEVAPSKFIQDLDTGTLAKHPANAPTSVSPGCVSYVRTLEALEQSLPKDRILVTDAGRFMTEVWCRISVPDPHSFFAPTSFGSIGLGLQAAIGACTTTDRPVVVFTGDGGFMLGGITEFPTAVRHELDLIVIVANDSAYGAEHIQFMDRQMDPGLSQFNWPSLAAVAEAMGGQGVTVTSEADLETAVAAIKDRNRPLLIELMLDPNDIPRMRA